MDNSGCIPDCRWEVNADNAITTLPYTDLFNTTTEVRSAQPGLINSATVFNAMNLEGGNPKTLTIHAATVLAGADAVAYSFHVQDASDLYRDAVGAVLCYEPFHSTPAKFSAANEECRPLNEWRKVPGTSPALLILLFKDREHITGRINESDTQAVNDASPTYQICAEKRPN